MQSIFRGRIKYQTLAFNDLQSITLNFSPNHLNTLVQTANVGQDTDQE